MNYRMAGLAAWLLAAGCGGRWEELPAQAPEARGADPEKRPCYVTAREPRAAAMWKGVLGSGGADSWTDDEPEMRCRLPESGAWEAVLDFRVEEGPLAKTGPVTVEIRLNGVGKARMRCDKAGQYLWRAAVPAALGVEGRELRLGMKIEPALVAEEDGQRLGVLLTGGGFVRR